VVSVTSVLVGSNSLAHKGQRWEYGIFECGKEWIWCEPGVLVITSSQRDFAAEMKVNTFGHPISPIQIINHLGAHSWELLTLSELGNIQTYWLKRPK